MTMPALLLETKPNTYLWVVAREYEVTVRSQTVVVPLGFVTDLATVPRFFQNIFPSDGLYKECAVVHDYLLESGYYSRKMCDRVFYNAMVDNGIKPLTAYVMYRAVRIYAKAKRLEIL